jgi:hypothetical protein
LSWCPPYSVGSQLSGGHPVELLRQGGGSKGETEELSVRSINLERLNDPDICLLDPHGAWAVRGECVRLADELERYGIG